MSHLGPEYWNRIAIKQIAKGNKNSLLAEHKKRIHLSLISRWVDVRNNSRVLKTDLFEEASGIDQLLFDLNHNACSLIGMDISKQVTLMAKRQATNLGIEKISFICCDIRHIPLRDNSIDVIVSDSTLDHFAAKIDVLNSLTELRRILQLGGVLVLTLDNRSNLTYPPYILMRLWMKIGLSKYYIGKTLHHKELRYILEQIGFEVQDSTAILHLPHPGILLESLEHCLHKLGTRKLDNAFRKCLALTDRLEAKRTKYLTGLFIAVKAVKREKP